MDIFAISQSNDTITLYHNSVYHMLNLQKGWEKNQYIKQVTQAAMIHSKNIPLKKEL